MFILYVRCRERLLARKEDRHRQIESMEVGLDFLSEDSRVAAPLDALRDYSLNQRENSGAFFEPDESVVDFVRDGDRLSFNSPLRTETPSNNRVDCEFFETHSRDRAAVLIPHWNATAAGYNRFQRLLRRAGVATVCMTLPYHDHRRPESHKLATFMVSANLGRTIRSFRQAVLEARLAVSWLEGQGYKRIGVVGSSLGSSIASVVAAHDSRVRAAALVMTAGNFGEAVWTGHATRHIRLALDGRLTLAQLNDIWSLISPLSYVERLGEQRIPMLILSGREDAVFQPHLTANFVNALREQGVPYRWRTWPCGHYTMGTFPFSVATLYSVIRFLRAQL